MSYLPPEKMVDVKLASGTILKLWKCARCGKPEISVKDEAKLRREKVQLGRCRCTKTQKASARA